MKELIYDKSWHRIITNKKVYPLFDRGHALWLENKFREFVQSVVVHPFTKVVSNIEASVIVGTIFKVNND